MNWIGRWKGSRLCFILATIAPTDSNVCRYCLLHASIGTSIEAQDLSALGTHPVSEPLCYIIHSDRPPSEL